MFYADQRRQILSRAIFSMWANWAIGMGCIILLIISAPWFTARFVPVVAVVLEFLLLYLERRNDRISTPTCFRIPYIAQTVLFFTAILLIPIIINISSGTAMEFTGVPVNADNPIIPVLLTGPITTVICLFYLIRGKKAHNHCSGCRRRVTDPGDRSILGILNVRESWFQIKFLFFLALGVTIVGWLYYFVFFINVSINKTDKFIFTAIPIFVYFLSLLYLGIRYYSIHMYYCRNEGMERYIARSGTTVRYLLVCEDKILLTLPKTDPMLKDISKVDTPLRYLTAYREDLPLHEAVAYFRERVHDKSAEIRELYVSRDAGMYYNTFHFVSFISPENAEQVAKDFEASWFTLYDVDIMMHTGLLAAEFVAEVRRVHKIAMAWKTYDKRGFRLYEIKHYTPTFRLKDMPKWDVDFNDTNWLYVADFNEDKPMFRLRRFWNRIIKGRGK